MNQQSRFTVLIEDIKKTNKIHDFLNNERRQILRGLYEISCNYFPDVDTINRREILKGRLSLIDTHMDFFAEMIAESANTFRRLVQGPNYDETFNFTSDDLYEIEGMIDNYVARHYDNDFVFDVNIDSFINSWHLKTGVRPAADIAVVNNLTNLNINSNYNDDDAEPQANSNDTFDETLLPGHDYVEQTKEKQPIPVFTEDMLRGIFREAIRSGNENELLELKEDVDYYYTKIEKVIPFHEERIVTRSLTKKLGENGIRMFELENHCETQLQRKRKEVNDLKKKDLNN